MSRKVNISLLPAQHLLPFLSALTVRWFKKASGVADQGADPRFDAFLSRNPVAGVAFVTDESTVWLLALLSPRDAAYTTLHECRHRAQTLANRSRSGSAPPRPMTKERRAALEQDADEWALAHVDEVRWYGSVSWYVLLVVGY